MNRYLLLIASYFVAFPIASSQEFSVNLQEPEYLEGIVKTEKGGVISAPCLRIQARKITYCHQAEIHTISAEEDLMMEYCDRIFVGEKLHFDLLTNTGYLIDGRTNINIWYLGGRSVKLLCDGTIEMEGAYITTSPSYSNPWEIKAKFVSVTEGDILTARDVHFNVWDFPLFWLPSYKSNLRKFRDTPVRYRILWDKGLGPRLSMRYRFYSNETFNAFLRLDYRWTRGPGGALEAEYQSTDRKTSFQTRNYAAYDKTFKSEKGPRRFRFQGLYKTLSCDEYTRFHIQWDRMSDEAMVNDFKDTDFEVNTHKTSYLDFYNYQDWTFAKISARARLNPFESMKEERPYGAFGIRPFEIWKTGILMENYASGSRLDYRYAHKVLDEALKNRASDRIETVQTFYRPFSFGGLNLTPRAGWAAIYYSASPEHHPIGQMVYSYGGDTSLRFAKQFESLKHVIQPYASYLGYTRPKAPVDSTFIFDIYDGYERLDQLRFGIRQLFYHPCNSIFTPVFAMDVYGYSFWDARSFNRRIPKLFADLEFNQPSYAILGSLGWNFEKNLVDYGNIRFLWTVNSAFAFSLEMRHRSQFWWRKAIHDNFCVDFARSLHDLIASPLSDQRNTFLTKVHFRLSPRWNLQLQTHHGWGRLTEPHYNGAKVDLYTMVTGNWQLRLSYEYSPKDLWRFSYSMKIIK